MQRNFAQPCPCAGDRWQYSDHIRAFTLMINSEWLLSVTQTISWLRIQVILAIWLRGDLSSSRVPKITEVNNKHGTSLSISNEQWMMKDEGEGSLKTLVVGLLCETTMPMLQYPILKFNYKCWVDKHSSSLVARMAPLDVLFYYVPVLILNIYKPLTIIV